MATYETVFIARFSKAGLSPGWVVRDKDGVKVGARSTAGVTEILEDDDVTSTGDYLIKAAIVEEQRGVLIVDDGESAPDYITFDINPEGPTEYLDQKISTLDAGSGANTVTITLQELAGTPKIADAQVTVKNSADDTIIAQLTTDANGQVVFSLDNGSYKLHKQKLSSYSFTNPETLTVSGTTTLTVIGTPLSVDAPAVPDICRLYIRPYNPDGTPEETTLTGNDYIKIIILPEIDSGAIAYEGQTVAFTWDASNALWYVDMPQGATVEINIPSAGYDEFQAVVPSTTTADITLLTFL